MTDKLPSTHRRDKKMACEPERYMVKNKKEEDEDEVEDVKKMVQTRSGFMTASQHECNNTQRHSAVRIMYNDNNLR